MDFCQLFYDNKREERLQEKGFFFKYKKENEFEYIFQVFDHMKDNFVDEKIGG